MGIIKNWNDIAKDAKVELLARKQELESELAKVNAALAVFGDASGAANGIRAEKAPKAEKVAKTGKRKKAKFSPLGLANLRLGQARRHGDKPKIKALEAEIKKLSGEGSTIGNG